MKLRAGHLILIAAGVTWLAGAVLPWAQVAGFSATYSALQLHMYTGFVVATTAGASLVVVGASARWWAGFVGLGAAFASAICVLAIHADAYIALRVVAPTLALGEVTHVTGYGVAVLFAGGLLAGAGGMVTAVQTAPKVVT